MSLQTGNVIMVAYKPGCGTSNRQFQNLIPHRQYCKLVVYFCIPDVGNERIDSLSSWRCIFEQGQIPEKEFN